MAAPVALRASAAFPERSPGIREASFDDYHKIAALQLRNGLVPKPPAEWSALWTSNPAYLKSEGSLPIGWVLETKGGEVVGFIGNLPLTYYLGGRDLRAATVYAWVVDSQYRGYSLTLVERFLAQKSVDLFICTTVNAIAEMVYSALGFSRAPAGRWDRSAFWITGYRGFVRSALRAASIPWDGLAAYPVAGALYLFDRLSERRHMRDSESEFEICSGFDSRFDDFWTQLKRENQNRLLATRDREALEWHFQPSLGRERAWVIAAAQGRRIVSYAIFDRQDHPALELKRLRFVDFQALRGFEYLLQPALAWMLRKCRNEGIHLAENVGCWLERLQVAQTTPPYRRRMKSWMFYYRARDKILSSRLKEPNVWAPSLFDGDASL